MRVAVTGATGFLGAHIVQDLIDTHHEPVCLVRPKSDRDHLEDLGVALVEGSLSDPESLRRLVKDAPAVIHAAGTVASWNPQGYHLANTEGTRNLLAACEDHPVDRFTYVSSLAAKGPSPTHSPLPAHSEPRPVSTYGASKLGGEQAVREHARSNEHTQTTIVRPPALYGPRDRRLLGVLKAAQRGYYALFLPADARLSLLHGTDCARLVSKTVNGLGKPERAQGDGVRLLEPADGPPHDEAAIKRSVMEAVDAKKLRTVRLPAPILSGAARAASIVARTTRTNLMLNPDKVKELTAKHWLSDTTSTDDVDWSPEYPLPAGMRATREWYEQEGWL